TAPAVHCQTVIAADSDAVLAEQADQVGLPSGEPLAFEDTYDSIGNDDWRGERGEDQVRRLAAPHRISNLHRFGWHLFRAKHPPCIVTRHRIIASEGLEAPLAELVGAREAGEGLRSRRGDHTLPPSPGRIEGSARPKAKGCF